MRGFVLERDTLVSACAMLEVTVDKVFTYAHAHTNSMSCIFPVAIIFRVGTGSDIGFFFFDEQ